MSLELILLGFLKRKPQTGYELQKKIERIISHFWTSTQSQIYRTLKRMEEEAFIRSEMEYQNEKPNKKVYSITGKGDQELITRLSAPVDIPNHRNPFLIQLFFSENVDKKTIISNLLYYKEEMEQRLKFLKSDEAKHMVESGNTRIQQFLYKSLQTNGLRMLQSEIDWVDETLREIEIIQEN